ncbi:rhomboid family intramembrane serine protease [Cellulophaga sp. E16_2]|uniref:Peptidase S54, rhomboid domain protein n=1 Tax=Cellulophaga algicola (strain DSM 14237 / IC166 / ACAM 630) TaxID=688270 RepID=E6XC45_CELAD|nr:MULTISPECIES: rhomboid family intramembrane serine protease [Cellulophaga]ADV50050.1 Peptidase S54, rhomboid domain protein [Cellulophaga algicola DSM 14237]MBO0592425.1 rhomboid family intramembrane serine protease [Cellulophaga sp. E16_2]
MIRITEAVKHLIIINVLFFVATLAIGDQMYEWFALWFPKNENFRIWQVITHMFMHGGPAHILFNMFGLWMFGSSVEEYLGKKQFLFLYFSAGLGAALFQLGFYYYEYLPIHSELINLGLTSDQIVDMISTNRTIDGLSEVQVSKLQEAFPIYRNTYFASMVGASGCIMGVLAAFGVMKPNAELMLMFLPIPIKAKYFIPGIILLDLFSALSGKSYFSPSNTAFMAHVGGAVVGFIMMWYWKKNSFNKNRWD